MKKHMDIGKEAGGLYFVDYKAYLSSLASSPSSSVQSSSLVSSQPRPSSDSIFSFSCHFSPLELWHCRLGHMPFDRTKHIDAVPSCNLKPSSICQFYHKTRQHRSSFPTSTSCTPHIFEMIHVGLWGSYANPTYDGYKYFITIVDDYSRATWTHLLSNNPMLSPFSNHSFHSLRHNFKLMSKL